jgi:hypothetical protein
MLIIVKLLHTFIWALLAGCILALPALAVSRRFRWAAIISAAVLLECAILAMNGGRCPLTDWAARYTVDRSPSFDIYLPNWLAQHNKFIFGILFVIGEVAVVACWLRQKSLISRQTLSRTTDGDGGTEYDHAGA